MQDRLRRATLRARPATRSVRGRDNSLALAAMTIHAEQADRPVGCARSYSKRDASRRPDKLIQTEFVDHAAP